MRGLFRKNRHSLRQQYINGDTREFLKAAAGPLTERLAEDAISDLRDRIQFNDQLDLLALAAWQSEDTTKQDILDDAEFLRELVTWSNGPGKVIALIMVLGGLALLVLIHRDDPPAMLRWTGVTLFTGGILCLIMGFSLNSTFPGEFTQAVGDAISYAGGAPSPVAVLGGDILQSLGDEVTEGFIWLSVLTLIAGLLAMIGSFLWDYRQWRR